MKTWKITFELDEDRRLKIESTKSDFTNIEKMGMIEIMKHELIKESFLNREEKI